MKYLALLFCLPLFLISFQLQSAPASGFILEYKKPDPPNTVKGILKNAKEHDFVLIRGEFTKIIDKENYTFRDEKGDTITVYFQDGIIPPDLTLNYEYYLWCEIIKRNDQKVLKVLVISIHS